MNYLPTLGQKWLHSRGNVGKYSLHGSFGISCLSETWSYLLMVHKISDPMHSDLFHLGKPSWENPITYPIPDDFSFPVWWDILVTGRVIFPREKWLGGDWKHFFYLYLGK